MPNARILTVYPNCSMGGMMTVYRNRIISNPDEIHHLVFVKDFGAARIYNELPNVRVDIVPKERLRAFVQLASVEQHYAEIRITSLPEVVNAVDVRGASKLIYEFHSSDEGVLKRELDLLKLDNLNELRVPSAYLAGVVRSLMPMIPNTMLQVEENLIDHSVFCKQGETSSWRLEDGLRPLVWVGRFDKGKNCRDFVRVLSLLGPEYVGLVIVSMEDAPERMAAFLGDVAAYGVQDRIHIMMNLSPIEIASLYRYARDASGYFVSTSLGESFGYGVAESMATGLHALAYAVGAIEERTRDRGRLTLVPVGDIEALAAAVLGEAQASLMKAVSPE